MANGMAFEFLDVGQGDGTLVQMPPWDSGELWLVDFGKKSNSDTPITNAVMFLVNRITEICRTRKILPTLDALVITHPDGDHWNRLGNLINGDIGTGNLWVAAGWPQGTTLAIGTLIYGSAWSEYQRRDATLANLVWQAATAKVGFPANYAGTAPQWSSGGATVTVLSANRGNGGDANPDSVVLMFTYAGRKAILTGDAESRIVEPALLYLYQNNLAFLKSTLLKFGHHGSKASSSQAWIDAVQPGIGIASGDKRWGHPYAEPYDRARAFFGAANLHRFCVSGGMEADDTAGDTDDYQNHNTKKNAFTNLWYVVKQVSETLQGPNAVGALTSQTYARGWYFGVQWRFQINTDGSLYMASTNQWPSPVDTNLWQVAGLPEDAAQAVQS